jgi:hypothetical protein
MRLKFFICCFFVIASCEFQQNGKKSGMKSKSISKNTFANCFSNLDTIIDSNIQIACIAGVYKRISNRYVVRILPTQPIQFDSCCIINLENVNEKLVVELLIFDQNDASLTNICSDIQFINFPKPTKILSAQIGELVIGYSDPTELYGNNTYHTTIFIKHLLFSDPISKDKIEVNNELLWKVLNMGTPG